MSKASRGNQHIDIAGNVECNWFAKPALQQNYFLSKNKSSKNPNLVPIKIEKRASNSEPKLSNSKKSLKKQKTVLNQSPRNQKCKNLYQEYYPANPSQNRFERVEFSKFPSPQFRQRNMQYKNIFRGCLPEKKSLQPLPHVINYQVPQFTHSPVYFNKGFVPELQIRRIKVNQPCVYSPKLSPRIYLSAQKKVQSASSIMPRYKGQIRIYSAIKIEELIKTDQEAKESINSQLTLKIPERKEFRDAEILSSRTIRQKVSEMRYEIREDGVFFESIKKKPQQKITFYKEDPSKPKLKEQKVKQKIIADKVKLNIPSFQSKIDTKKSCIDDRTGCSKITLKKGKPQKSKLKNIDDVQQIKSLNDSQQLMSDDDNQSIVLAKLNDYGSFVDPALSAVNSCPTTFKSRLVYQSSIPDNSTVKGQSSHFK